MAKLLTCKDCQHEVSKSAKKCPNCGAVMKRQRTKWYTWVIGIPAGLLVAGWFVSLPEKQAETAAALKNVTMDFAWHKGGFDAVMLADITVTNTNSFGVKDLKIECDHYSESGTKIDSNERTIFKVVPANDAKTFEGFNMGFMHSQATSSACEVVGLNKV